MKPRSWIRNLFARRPATNSQRLARRRATARLYLEGLEQRLVPAPALLSNYGGIDQGTDEFLGGYSAIQPNPTAAIGTDHTVAVVNAMIEIRATGGGGIPARTALSGFFGISSSTANISESKVLWDRQSQRFFLTTLDRDTRTSTSLIHLAVSPTGDPSNFNNWHTFSFDASETINGHNTYAVHPGFASDSVALYITADKDGFDGSGYSNNARLWIVNKASLINGTLAENRYGLPGSFARGGVQPAQMYQDMPTGPGTFLTSWGQYYTLYVARVTNPLSNPTFTVSSLFTGQIDLGAPLPGAPQPNSSALIDTGDQRIESAVWSHGQLYATNTVSGVGGSRDFAHWFRVDTNDVNNVRLADHGSIGGGSAFPNLYTYDPSVTVDDAGNMAVSFSGSGATSAFASAFYTTRLAGDPPGYTEPIAYLYPGDDVYNQVDPLGHNLWGGYSAAGLAPDGHTFLFYNELAGLRHIGYPNGFWLTHYGTTAYANHYRLVTSGGVTTLTTDNSVTSVGLNRSGSSTQILVNGANIGSTTAAIITVDAGFVGTTALTVSNTASGAYTLTGSQLVSPGLTVNVSNLGDVELDDVGTGGNITVVNTPAGPGHTTTVKTGFGPINTVTVQATSGALTVNISNSAYADVALGNANSLAGITGTVIINGPSHYQLEVNDGADNTNHPNVQLTASSLTGLAPAAISFASATLDIGPTITVGNGTNTYTVANTPSSFETRLNAGAGTDTVNVQTNNARTLTLNLGGGGNDVVNLGNANSVAGINGTVAVNASARTRVNVNDSADNANHANVVLSATALTGLAPAPINFGPASVNTLTVTGGNGANTYTVSGTPGNVGTTLNTGTGTNTVTVTGTNGPITFSGNPTGVNTLVGPNADTTWNVTGADAGNFNSAVASASFTGYGNLTGGSGSNTFVVSDGAALDGTLDGGSGGNNTLNTSAYSTAESFTLTGTDAGTGTPVAAFVDIQNLVGAGVGGSYFQFADGATLDGSLVGGGSDTLDYSLYTTSIVVDLQPAVASATGVGGSISGFTTVIGASGAPGAAGLYNLLIGSDVGGDTLQGGTGRRNLLVAGGGASTLIAGDGEDLLIGGTTAYDTDPALTNWLAIADYWVSTDDFATRSANLLNGNGVPLLDASTVTGNGGGNVFQGNGGTALIYTDGQDAIDNGFADTSLVTIAP